MKLTAADVADELGLEPLDHEGGLWTRTHLDAHSSAIYYLIVAGDFSALHRLDATEVWHHYGGAPARLLVLHPDGRIDQPVLGPDLATGQRPQLAVPAGAWQGGSTLGDWSLLGTTMAPPFHEAGFELARRTDLIAFFPSVSARIEELIR
ncbi:MAG: cupin domain-containing protein [Acidimicrobiales bacterium]